MDRQAEKVQAKVGKMEGEILYLYLGPDAFAGLLLDCAEKVVVKTGAVQHYRNGNECQHHECGEADEGPCCSLPQPRVRAGKLVLRCCRAHEANLRFKMPGQCLQNT